MANVYETGSTVMLKAIFTDSEDVLTNVDGLPTVAIYDRNYRQVASLTSEQESQGTYKALYSIPEGVEETVYYYEFKGVMAGVTSLNRNRFLAKFIN
jgi:hypothetical protein